MESGSSAVRKQEPVEFSEETLFSSCDWFTSLSDSELDLLISLKELVISRAKSKGCDDLAERISIYTLRGLAVILLEYLKERMCGKSIFQFSQGCINPLDMLELMKSDNTRRSESTMFSYPNSSDFATHKKRKRQSGIPGQS